MSSTSAVQNPSSVADAAERARALDAETSFIIQAPAGSGKTELLIQRFLVLLARVQAPEEIVAVTFTRKAAGEMRHRILKALESAEGPEPESPHARLTWNLARAALERETALRWDLRRYPSRLRVQTIDSLCASITRQMPRLAGFGAQPGIAEKAGDLHREAARRTLAALEDGGPHAGAVARLLTHLDTNFDRVERLLVEMLAARDQWLRHIVSDGRSDDPAARRAMLEGALRAVVRDSLIAVCEAFPRHAASRLIRLIRACATYLSESGASIEETPILHCAGLTEETLGAPSSQSLDEKYALDPWLGVASLLLTKEGTWRARCDRRIGFPAPKDSKDPTEQKIREEHKEAFKELICSISEETADSSRNGEPGSLSAVSGGELFRHRLHALRSLPAMTYPDSQWEILEALVALLPVAVAHLRLVFQSRGEVDFTEVAMRASEALGSEDEPTDLALALDYRLQHLLVDEFQDTSLGQYSLLERLTAGWEPGDGRTMFLVGDPMQSIYRFREAEVGLFLRSAAEGQLGTVGLEFLRLRCNFRSDARIVEWVNETFADVLPSAPDTLTGAVPYSASAPARPSAGGERTTVHPLLTDDPELEARLVVDLVREELVRRVKESENGSSRRVAILVRSRSHLLEILPALREAEFAYRALDIDLLAGRPAVQDLLALTRALLHPGDRIAWLAVLRAPWCGLLADDLHGLASADHQSAIWDLVSDATGVELWDKGNEAGDQAIQQVLFEEGSGAVKADATKASDFVISEDGMGRLRRVAAVLGEALATRCRPSLRRWVEGTWLALGGPSCAKNASDLSDAREYLNLLDDLNDGGDIESFDALEEHLSGLYALPDPEADGTLQVMTIHKAKGLEFDVVILPGLGRRPAVDQKRLLLWAEIPDLSSTNKLVLAPIEETGQTSDPIYNFIWGIHRNKGANEAGRVLYVAATRAREHLHLVGHATTKADKEGVLKLRAPGENTMLGLLWSSVESDFTRVFEAGGGNGSSVEVLEVAAEPVAHESGAENAANALQVRRLPFTWTAPSPSSDAPAPASLFPSVQHSVHRVQAFTQAGTVTRHIGTIIHRWLRIIAAAAERDGQVCDVARLQGQHDAIRAALVQVGVAANDADDAAARVLDALSRTVKNERGAWLLGPGRREARSNLSLTGVYQGQIVTANIDRTFLDQDGVRWIVDYKASTHEGGSLDRFLDAQVRQHHPVMEMQAALFRAMYPGSDSPIRAGLYFPHLTAWREWEP